MKSIYIFLSIWLMCQIVIVWWMFRAKPGKLLTRKYSTKVIFRSQLPFGCGWKKQVDKIDIETFEKYQRRIRWWYLSLIIPFFLFLTFA